MAQGNLLYFTKCRRSSGNLFSFYTSLYPNGKLGHLPIEDMVSIAKKVFPKKQGNARFNLVVSHAKRQMINRICWLEKSRGQNILKCNLADEIVDGIYKGCPLIGNTNEKGKSVNGAFYQVIDWNEDFFTIEDIETNDFLVLPLKKSKNFRIGFSITYHAIQSRSLKERVRLHDCNHPYFTKKHLAMGLGRATSADLIDLA